MINFINTVNNKAIIFFNILRIGITIDKGLLIDTYGINIKIYKIELAFLIGKEVKDGKKIRKNIKESKNNDAFA